METEVKSKKDFQEKQKKMEQDYKRKSKNPNHIVHPNLTPRGRDILMRLQNKSLDTEGNRQYTMNEDIVNARTMSVQELRAAAQRNQAKIEQLRASLESNASKKKTDDESKKKTDDESNNG